MIVLNKNIIQRILYVNSLIILPILLYYAVFNASHICATHLQSIHPFQILLFIDNFSHTKKKRDNLPIAGSIENHIIP